MDVRADQMPPSDELGREPFAKQIADNVLNYLKQNEESLVIGIHGEWGSGKSVLLNYIISELKFQSKAITKKKKLKTDFIQILQFNPWMFSGKEHLQSIFLNELGRKIGHTKQRIRNFIKSMSEKVAVLDGVTGTPSAVKAIADVSLDDLKDEINTIMVDQQIRIVIVMDDLDRLPPQEILVVFQLIKMNANFKNTLFLVSFDKAVVIKSVNSQFKLDGERYLEKIIQVDYSLPSVLSEDLESIFFRRLRELSITHEFAYDEKEISFVWLYKGLSHLFSNLRDINRFFNAVSFRLPSIIKNVDIHDFLLIEVIRLFDFTSYEIIRDNYKRSKQFGERSSFFNNLDNLVKRPGWTLYNYLFDKSNSHIRANRYPISDTAFFDRYFSLAISKKDLREEEVEHFINHSPSRKDILDTAIGNGKIDFLLRRLATRNVIPEGIDQSELISVLISCWDEHPEEFVNHWRNVWETVKALAKLHNNSNIGFKVLIDRLNMSSSNFSPGRFLFTYLLLEPFHATSSNDYDRDLDDVKDLLESRRESIERNFSGMLNNYQTIFFYNRHHHTFFLRIFLPSFCRYLPGQYNDLFINSIADEDRLLRILDLIVHRHGTTSKGVAIDNDFARKILPDTVQGVFRERLAKINLRALEKHDALGVEAYLLNALASS